jgi:hypothetical protein
VIWWPVLLICSGLRPSRFCGLPSASPALFICHSFKAAFPANLSTLRAHLAHYLLDYGELGGFRGFNSLQENASGILNGIQVFASASPLWHDFRLAQIGPNRQVVNFSNGPTTRIWLRSYSNCLPQSRQTT